MPGGKDIAMANLRLYVEQKLDRRVFNEGEGFTSRTKCARIGRINTVIAVGVGEEPLSISKQMRAAVQAPLSTWPAVFLAQLYLLNQTSHFLHHTLHSLHPASTFSTSASTFANTIPIVSTQLSISPTTTTNPSTIALAVTINIMIHKAQ
jgi:hypothetical protein